MLHIPILRHGEPYTSMDTFSIVHHATGEPAATVSLANAGMLARDIHRMQDDVLEALTVSELIEKCRKAAKLFMTASLPVGNATHSFEDYIEHLSATTGMPVSTRIWGSAEAYARHAAMSSVVKSAGSRMNRIPSADTMSPTGSVASPARTASR